MKDFGKAINAYNYSQCAQINSNLRNYLLKVFFFGFVYFDNILDLVYGGGKFEGAEMIFVVVISDAGIEVVSGGKSFLN